MKTKIESLKEKLFNRIDLITIAFFAIYLLLLLLNQTAVYQMHKPLEKVFKILRYICYIVFIIKIIYDWKNGSNITITMILIGILSVIICYFARKNAILVLLIVLLAVRNLDKKKLIEAAYYVCFIGFSIVIILSLLKIFPDWIFYREEKYRHSLGFVYATTTISIYLHLVLMYCYVNRENSTYIELILLELVNIALYYYTDGRMSFLLITLAILVMILQKSKFIKRMFHSNIVHKVLKVICILLPTFLYLTYNVLAMGYSQQNKYIVKLDKLLSGRLKYTTRAYIEHDITLFGEPIEWKRMGRIWLCEFREYEEL